MAAYARDSHLHCHSQAFEAHKNKKANELSTRRSRPTISDSLNITVAQNLKIKFRVIKVNPTEICMIGVKTKLNPVSSWLLIKHYIFILIFLITWLNNRYSIECHILYNIYRNFSKFCLAKFKSNCNVMNLQSQYRDITIPTYARYLQTSSISIINEYYLKHISSIRDRNQRCAWGSSLWEDHANRSQRR